MRHSSVELTMKAYTDVRLLDLRRDVERIAPGRDAFPAPADERLTSA